MHEANNVQQPSFCYTMQISECQRFATGQEHNHINLLVDAADVITNGFARVLLLQKTKILNEVNLIVFLIIYWLIY